MYNNLEQTISLVLLLVNPILLAYGAITQRQMRDLHPAIATFHMSLLSSVGLIIAVYAMGDNFQFVLKFNYVDWTYFISIVILIGVFGYYMAKAYNLDTPSRL